MIKRIFVTLILPFALLPIAGCGSNDMGKELSQNDETYIGSFTSLGEVKINPLVTHVFEREDGEILYAYSNRYDLSEYSDTMEVYGIVTTYEDYEKAFFEVKRLNKIVETKVDEKEVQEVEYRNTSMGAMTTVFSDWDIQENTSSWVTFKIPTPLKNSPEELDTPPANLLNDTIDWVLFTDALTSTAEDDSETRANEIRTYVSTNYSDLSLVDGELTSIGPDQILGVRYKTVVGDIFVFIPRGNDLFEVSFHYFSMDETIRLQNTNAFSSTLNDFRFIPEQSMELESSTEEITSEIAPPLVTQISINKYSTFSSSTFGFTISYPSSWYYAGGSTGYHFDIEPIEDMNTGALLKLNFNSSTQEGILRNGTTVSITRKVNNRYYTLTGSSEYETVMQTMLDSIQTTIAE